MTSRREAVRSLVTLAAGATLSGWLAGCGRVDGDPIPPEIALDRDACDWCRMTIDDVRLAAAFLPASGRALRFGEPGCLLAWLAEHPGVEGAAFVTAREDAGWIAAESARFARGVVRTPMRFDLAAWRGRPEVATVEIVTWTRLRSEGAPHARRD